MRISKFDENHPLAVEARNRVPTILDSIEPAALIDLVKRTPSCRGVLTGTIAELQFLKFARSIPKFSGFYKPDDHNRAENKIDLRVIYKGHPVTFQLKSIQTNSVRWNRETENLEAGVQNDGSDSRDILLPNGHTVHTTNYKFGDYDILAVPLFPFTGKWNFAYLLNADCTVSTARKYNPVDRKHLISTMEKITFPLSGKWTDDIFKAIDKLFARRKLTP